MTNDAITWKTWHAWATPHLAQAGVSGVTEADDSAPGRQPLPPSPQAVRHAQLLGRVGQSQDRAAFAELYAHFGPRLKSYMSKLGTPGDAAEELVQETMILIWRKAAQYDPARAAAATWIFTIARNRRIDALRRERRPQLDANDPLVELYEQPVAGRITELAYESERLQDAIAALPEDQAAVVKMSFLEDKTHRMIADELDIPLGTVKSRLRLAFRRLRMLMGEPE